MHRSELALVALLLFSHQLASAFEQYQPRTHLRNRQASEKDRNATAEGLLEDSDVFDLDDVAPYQASPQPEPEPFINPPISTSQQLEASNVSLTGRDFGEARSFIVVTSKGSVESTKGGPIYPLTVNQQNMTTMLEDAKIWAVQQQAAGAQGNESDHGYFRFCSQYMSLAAVAYNQATQGQYTFGFREYYNIADHILKKSRIDPNGHSWEGTLEDAQHKPYVDILVTPCFEDLEVDPKHLPPEVTNPDSQGPDNPKTSGTDGADFAVAKRARPHSRSHRIPHTRDLWYTVYTTKKVRQVGSMHSLAVQAVNTVKADTGHNRQYAQLTIGIDGAAREEERLMRNVLLQYKPVSGMIDRDTLLAILQPLAYYAEREGWDHHLSDTVALHYEIRQGGARGRIIGRMSWGDALYRYLEVPVGRKPVWWRFNCFRGSDTVDDGLY